jgi:hypothetical protein
MFFAINEDAVIIVSGSDSHDDFINDCLPTCKKKCVEHCKNYQKRIKTYRYYVDKNVEDLSVDYSSLVVIKVKQIRLYNTYQNTNTMIFWFTRKNNITCAKH